MKQINIGKEMKASLLTEIPDGERMVLYLMNDNTWLVETDGGTSRWDFEKLPERIRQIVSLTVTMLPPGGKERSIWHEMKVEETIRRMYGFNTRSEIGEKTYRLDTFHLPHYHDQYKPTYKITIPGEVK